MTIYFYKVNEPYGCFSNFSPHPFIQSQQFWPTSEHYFQAMKFLNTKYQEKIRNAKSPMDAAIMGRDRNLPLRCDWENVKDDIMFSAVLCKFQSHTDILETLLSTGNEEIVEKTTTDYYWGCGSNNTGKNMLGQILMRVRAKLKI